MNIGRLHRAVNNFSRGEWEFNPVHFETFQCSMSFLYPDEQEHFVVCSPSAASRWLVGRRRDCKPWATTFDEHTLTSIFNFGCLLSHFCMSVKSNARMTQVCQQKVATNVHDSPNQDSRDIIKHRKNCECCPVSQLIFR